MFYAFTLAFSEHYAIDQGHSLLQAMLGAVLDHGQYVVLLLLPAELWLFAKSVAARRLHACGANYC